MTRRNKQRGYELEAEVVKHWDNSDVDCKRVFASGAYKEQLGDKHKGDLMLSGFVVECKRRKNGGGFKFLLDSLDQDNADILICRQDGRPIRRLYVMEEETVEALFRQSGVIK